tara:strand:+ start:2037 stop:2672 length:636 start_codon:yes stop_codon:yes gene_type:complete
MKHRSRLLLLDEHEEGKGGSGGGAGDVITKEQYDSLQAKLSQTLDQVKTLSTTNEEYSGKLKQIETEKLNAEGNQAQIIENQKKEIETLSSTTDSLKNKFSMTLAKTSLVSALKSKGCDYVDDAISLYSNDLKTIDVNKETFEADTKSIESLVSRIQKEKAFLFKADAPGTSDLNQTKHKEQENKEGYIAELSKAKNAHDVARIKEKYNRS